MEKYQNVSELLNLFIMKKNEMRNSMPPKEAKKTKKELPPEQPTGACGKLPYLTPSVNVLQVELEGCFAASAGMTVDTESLKYNEYGQEQINSSPDIELY
jgi:hypothetical protein